tara:strand:- start:700 stop:1098 length:399 start_codon:yes stop_codon:yes gene_type:complete
MSRGRPAEQFEVLDKWVLDGKDHTGERHIIKFDRSKSSNGPYSFEVIPPKKTIEPKIKVEKNKPYAKLPVVLVYKTSNRSNAQTKIKVYANENIDYILSSDKLVGIPSKAEILDIGVGEKMISRYKEKYNLN